MRILSIDPGYERLGIAIVEKKQKGKEVLIHSECFKTLAKDPHPTRLGQIHNKIIEIIETYKPDTLSIETLFFQNNAKTAMQVAETRGTIISICAARGLSVAEFSPLQIKAAVTGNGRSDKEQMIKMVPMLLKIDKPIKHDDEYDAIACGLTYFAYNPVK
jgi:crossover junction endodeoxyribonuclease RuvC